MKANVSTFIFTALVFVSASQGAEQVVTATNAAVEAHWDIMVVEMHREALEELLSAGREFKIGKCKITVLHSAAVRLRRAELAMSTTKEQMVAAWARYAAVLHELEEETTVEADKLLVAKWRERADKLLLQFTNANLSAADLQAHRQITRDTLQRERQAKEQAERRRQNNKPRSGLLYPTLPPRFVD